MKSIAMITVTAALTMLLSQLATAGSITDTYSTGDTLTATMLDNIKTAVNDNDSSKQDRVSGVCAEGSSIRTINDDGTVECQTDSDTTYSAGNGLTLIGTTFSASDASPGVAFIDENTCCTDVPASPTEMQSVTIDAPGAGFVIVSYSGICRLWHVNAASNTLQTIKIAISTTSGSVVASSLKTFSLPGNSGGGMHEAPCSTQQVFAVSAGTQTYYLNAEATLPRVDETASIGWGNMNALYVPTQY